MLSVAVQSFDDPYKYQAFTCDAQHRVVVTGSGPYEARTIRLDLHRVMLRRAWQTLPTVSHLTIPTGRSAVCFPLNAHETSWSWGGAELQAGEIFVVHSGGDFHSRAGKGGEWASVSMASDVLATYVQARTGSELSLAEATQVRPRSEAMSRLLAVHEAAGSLAENAPDIVTRPEVATVIEDELMHAIVDCLTAPERLTIRRSHRQPVMRRFEEFLEANPDQLLHVLDVCSAIGVSERTLRLHCLEHLGVNPHRYLWLRRMHQVHRTLASADAAEKTVTEIATDHGFWELGRFSVAYRQLFGEPPSLTLRRV